MGAMACMYDDVDDTVYWAMLIGEKLKMDQRIYAVEVVVPADNPRLLRVPLWDSAVGGKGFLKAVCGCFWIYLVIVAILELLV